jgi:glyoxylase-like metal-dependent hydrolase (beta-lactamase superfamily II)
MIRLATFLAVSLSFSLPSLVLPSAFSSSLRTCSFTFALCPLPFALTRHTPQTPPASAEVYAVQFASIRYSVGQLVAGGDRTRPIDIAMMVWPVKLAGGRVIVVDAGFYREKFLQQWKPLAYTRPADAVSAGLGIAPESVTDVVISHVHWDHADGADLFPRARIWIQREEFEHYIGDGGTVLDRAIDRDVAAMLFQLKAAGRVHLIDGDDREIAPGVRVYTGGKHTFASQYVSVQTRSGPVILASDNAYLYENLEKHLAIAQTLDPQSNLAAQSRMITLAGAPNRVVPGHDPGVFLRFPVVKFGVVRID